MIWMQDTKVSEKVFRYFGILQGKIPNCVKPIFFKYGSFERQFSQMKWRTYT